MPAAPASAAESSGDEEGGVACLLTSGDIARLLDVDLKTVHNWVKLGHLCELKTKGGHLRFHRAEVVRFMRRFGYPVSGAIGGSEVRVALVGLALDPNAIVGFRPTSFERLFDAVLALAAGEYEILVVSLDVVTLPPVAELVRALRNRALTRSVALIGVSDIAGLREAFVTVGGDAALGHVRELDGMLRFFGGVAA